MKNKDFNNPSDEAKALFEEIICRDIFDRDDDDLMLLDWVSDTDELSDDWFKNKASIARGKGSIRLYYLFIFLAKYECNNDLLSQLWDILEMNNENKYDFHNIKQTIKGKDSNFDVKMDRFAMWWLVLSNLTASSYYFQDSDIVIPLRDNNGEPIAAKNTSERNESQFVNLDEVKKYFVQIGKEFQLKIHFPKLLFPIEKDIEKNISGDDDDDGKPIHRLINCPSEIKWEDIKITLLSNEMVKIKIEKSEKKYTFQELGMSNKTIGDKPKKIWTLLIAFAKSQGFVNFENITNEDLKKNLKKTASLLNCHFKDIFGIDESIYDGTYNKFKRICVGHDNFGQEKFKNKKGYKTKIFFSDATFVNSNIVDNHHESLIDEERVSAESKVNLTESKKYQN